jgi:peptidoglycan/LPS O-acetylase OafA/YrhL
MSSPTLLESTVVAPLPEVALSRVATPASPPETPAKKRSGRYLSLDMWRGTACLMLVLYHTSFYVESPFRVRDLSTWSIAGGTLKAANFLWVGVPIFFVVSGYCIAASFDSLRRRSCSLKTYFGRRMRRIYPPLWVACLWAVGVTWGIHYFWPDLFQKCVQLPRWQEWTLWNWLGNVSATESWQYHLSGTRVSYLMKNTWTLCYEEQFYAIVGLFLFLASGRFLGASLLLCGLTLACRHIARWQGWDLDGWFFQGHWLLFAAGIFLHHQLTHATRRQWWATSGLFLLGICYAVVDRQFGAIDEGDKHLDEYLFVSCSFAFLLLALRPWDTNLNQARLLGPLRWCGQRSYSIYLTHYPVVVALSCFLGQVGYQTPEQWFLVTLPLCVAVSLLLGWIFFILVERYFLNAPMDAKTASVEA